MCELDIDEYSKVWCETEHKARKPHTCDCCGTVIVAGERYIRHFSVLDGISREDICKPCDTVRRRFADAHNIGSCTPRSLLPYLYECALENDDDSWKWDVAIARIRKRAEKRAKKTAQGGA